MERIGWRCYELLVFSCKLMRTQVDSSSKKICVKPLCDVHCFFMGTSSTSIFWRTRIEFVDGSRHDVVDVYVLACKCLVRARDPDMACRLNFSPQLYFNVYRTCVYFPANMFVTYIYKAIFFVSLRYLLCSAQGTSYE